MLFFILIFSALIFFPLSLLSLPCLPHFSKKDYSAFQEKNCVKTIDHQINWPSEELPQLLEQTLVNLQISLFEMMDCSGELPLWAGLSLFNLFFLSFFLYLFYLFIYYLKCSLILFYCYYLFLLCFLFIIFNSLLLLFF